MQSRLGPWVCVVVLGCLAAVSAQPGPEPGIRAHVQALVDAYNSGSAAQWEAMAGAHFAPVALARQTPEDRKRLFDRMRGDFGRTIAVDRVLRRGPEAPLDVHVRGASGLQAIIRLEVEPEPPYRITSLAVEVGGPDDEADDVPRPPISAGMSPSELSAALARYLGALAQADRLSGAVLVAKDGAAIFQQAYGFADRANKVPNTTATRFNVGSINKAYTQVAIAQLVRAGKLSYTDTLGALIPDYPQEATRPATVQQLLDHRAGISDFFGDVFQATPKDRFRSNEDYYRFVSSRTPLFAPGERYQYCNGCYITLGAMVERVSGMPYEKYIGEHVFARAGMRGAGYLHVDAIEPAVAMGYTRRAPGGDGQLRSNVHLHGAAGSAAGGSYATAADLLAFDNALREGKLLDHEASARLLRQEKPAAANARLRGEYRIAGGAPGTNAILASNGEWTVVVLTNFDPRTGEQVGSAIATALSGRR